MIRRELLAQQPPASRVAQAILRRYDRGKRPARAPVRRRTVRFRASTS